MRKTVTENTSGTTGCTITVPAALSGSGKKEKIILPLPPAMTDLDAGQDTRFEMDIYARFMRHLRDVPNSRMDIRILAAIQFTADALEMSEALIAKTLVDLGLRAPRRAFPGTFLDFCDRAVLRRTQDQSGVGSVPPQAVLLLKDHWDGTGEERFGPLPVHYAVFNEGVYV